MVRFWMCLWGVKEREEPKCIQGFRSEQVEENIAINLDGESYGRGLWGESRSSVLDMLN